MKKGFTLIEILVVIAIIGVLGSIFYKSYQGLKVKFDRIEKETKIDSFNCSNEDRELLEKVSESFHFWVLFQGANRTNTFWSKGKITSSR